MSNAIAETALAVNIQMKRSLAFVMRPGTFVSEGMNFPKLIWLMYKLSQV